MHLCRPFAYPSNTTIRHGSPPGTPGLTTGGRQIHEDASRTIHVKACLDNIVASPEKL